MKKLFFAIAIFAFGLTLQVNADALSILKNTKIKAQQTVSVHNLAQLFINITNYRGSHKKYPKLEEIDLPIRTLMNPYGGLNSEPAAPDKITVANCAYAYFGAVLNDVTAGGISGSMPLAFEKPSIRDDGKLYVLLVGGKVELKNIEAKNCAEVIAALKKEAQKPDEAVWDKLLLAAKAIDQAK
ncbi:MAG: hypothetical protein LBM70_06965 [Victivallales bacterium]|jgi:hypothetical protein|nr:hypothetical protein [Victivallales bacterium]